MTLSPHLIVQSQLIALCDGFVLLQMSSLISENRGLVARLERGSKLLHAQSSSVEEEVLAVEQVRYDPATSDIRNRKS